jgi:hypothetical protein
MCEQWSYKCGCIAKLTRCVRRGRSLARLIKPASVSFVLRAIKLSRPKEKVQFNNLFSKEKVQFNNLFSIEDFESLKAEIFIGNLNLFELLLGCYFWVKIFHLDFSLPWERIRHLLCLYTRDKEKKSLVKRKKFLRELIKESIVCLYQKL